MIIFKKKSVLYVYIHIPKNAGKALMNQVYNDPESEVIICIWGQENNIDHSHTPYILRKNVILNNLSHTYFSYSRNPYDF